MIKLLEKLNWRYAAKRMTGEKIPLQKLESILEAIRLSPSSAGLQPYTIFVISNPELRKEIFEKSCPQPQITECSHLLVFASKTNITDSYIKEIIDNTANSRNLPIEAYDGYFNMIKSYNDSLTEIERAISASRQTYIALGTGLIAAAFEEIDACPMEGFNRAMIDEILELKQKGLQSVVLLSLGYRDQETDSLVKAKKARKSKEQLFVEIN